jgi:hypothetical protein
MKTQVPCKRCGEPFEPRLLERLQKMSTHCGVCEARNLFDGLDLPTPPRFLDRHTKRPTLSEREFQAELQKDKSNE